MKVGRYRPSYDIPITVCLPVIEASVLCIRRNGATRSTSPVLGYVTLLFAGVLGEVNSVNPCPLTLSQPFSNMSQLYATAWRPYRGSLTGGLRRPGRLLRCSKVVMSFVVLLLLFACCLIVSPLYANAGVRSRCHRHRIFILLRLATASLA